MANLEEFSRACEFILKEIRELTALHSKLTDEVVLLKNDKEKLVKSVVIAKKDLIKAQDDKIKAEAEFKEYISKEKAQLREDTDKFDNYMTEKQLELAERQKEVKKVESSIEGLKTQQRVDSGHLAEKEAKIDDKLRQYLDKRKRLDEDASALAELSKNLDKRETDLDARADSFQETVREVSKLKQSAIDAESRAKKHEEDATRMLDKAQDTITSLKSAEDKLRVREDSLDAKANTLELKETELKKLEIRLNDRLETSKTY